MELRTSIREATAADVEMLFDIRCSVTENHMSRKQLARANISSASLERMITGGDYVTPVVEAGGQAVAFAMAQVSRGYLFALFVRPGHEKKGFGKTALQAAEAGLRERGVRFAWLSTGQDESLRAHGFYRHLGWTQTGFMSDGQAKYEKALE
jgi:GNAT superfamily N-acetyltransferase